MFNDGIVPEPDGSDSATESIHLQYPVIGKGEREPTPQEIEMRAEYKEASKMESHYKAVKADIRNKLKLKMGSESLQKIKGIAYLKEYPSFKKELLVKKLKQLELEHLVDESVVTHKRFTII